MRIGRIEIDGEARWGVIEGDVVRMSAATHPLEGIETVELDIEVPLAEAALLAPVEPGAKILCVGLNYRDHVTEMGHELPSRPVIFTRYADSLVGPGEALILPEASDNFDYEGEFAIVIGRSGRAIGAEHSFEHVLGYTALNDGTLRDFQRHTTQFTPGKNFAASGAVGPWITTSDDFGAVASQRIRTTVDDELRQDSSLDQLIFGVAELISYISTWTPLRPGDIIATGTPSGVGDSFDPPKWLRDGSRVSIDIEGIGTLSNTVVGERRAS